MNTVWGKHIEIDIKDYGLINISFNKNAIKNNLLNKSHLE